MIQRVVVTGLGTVNPLSRNVSGFWDALINKKNGINKITHFDSSNFKTKLSAEVNIDLNNYFNKKELNKIDRFTAFALIASNEAIIDAKIDKTINKNRVGVIIGSGIGGINTLEKEHKKSLKSPRRVSPYFVPSMISDIAAGHISIKYNLKGPNHSVVTACASGAHAIGDSFRIISYGDADVMIAGEVIRQATGKNADQYLSDKIKNHVFDPYSFGLDSINMQQIKK